MGKGIAMLKILSTVKGEKTSADVVFVDPSDCLFLTWWNKPAYFITTSKGEFFSCLDEQSCIEEAKEEVEKE
jgi:hypothetical protein